MPTLPWKTSMDPDEVRRAMFDDPCFSQNAGRRRIFWTTQQQACGEYVLCGQECSIPGLQYVDTDDPHVSPGGPPRTIKNDEWTLGLILNILNTRARTDLRCPSPAAVFGHWSESYRDDGLWIGSRLWNAAEKSYVRVADSVKAIQAAVQADMSKLVMLGVADSVNVEAVYRGRNTVAVTVTAIKRSARHVLNLSGTFVSDTWVWH
jgi:phage gp46-like protein